MITKKASAYNEVYLYQILAGISDPVVSTNLCLDYIQLMGVGFRYTIDNVRKKRNPMIGYNMSVVFRNKIL